MDKMLIWHAQPFDDNFIYPTAKLGEVVEVIGKDFVVNCADGTLLVTDYDSHRTPYVGDVLTSRNILEQGAIGAAIEALKPEQREELNKKLAVARTDC